MKTSATVWATACASSKEERSGYDIVRETWNPILGEAEFDSKWNRVLHDGLLSGSELPEVVPGRGNVQ